MGFRSSGSALYTSRSAARSVVFEKFQMEELKALQDEAAAIDECTTLIASMSEQIASMAKNVHVMGECADATIALLRNWTS